ncbi:UDP-N-acetylglucosamine 2-epimerase (non-hydrolysing) [Prosthecobacter debontii]|uniref:UDP-N-acetylglucosamine 2-epimerase (non-hydrolyzing) n=1 Tax=Prosthecobacter debontii TaxID=48467 RepID=A0A1T4YGB2_9BACT|nr:UDP-N-acetylglucosamine 2-epimerase (non-hydrolyzing) [Prosthecobacter debontii]SKB00331.1 UDP-N-acetylglucosamine 2-epimerase (non-hydrolysing) [Prosthecobacter debontii]
MQSPVVSKRLLFVLGTRPEMIKVAPLILEARKQGAEAILVNSGQHADLLTPLFDIFGVYPQHDLQAMVAGQPLNRLLARVIERLDPVLEAEQPDYVLVQGDTATALGGAQAAFHRQIPVGHIEAGLRSGNPLSPFPEEMNRRLVSQIATLHFAATERNRLALRAEGIEDSKIIVTGNTVVDALYHTLSKTQPGPEIAGLREKTAGRRVVLLTTHRRENFGETMRTHLRLLRRFTEAHPELCVVFPVHPNPAVKEAAAQELAGCDQIIITTPMAYADFVHLLSDAWLIVSDSGGIQEEAASLGKPILVLRENTERPEGVDAGVARLVGESATDLESLLNTAVSDTAWFDHAARAEKVFGDGHASERILAKLLQS